MLFGVLSGLRATQGHPCALSRSLFLGTTTRMRRGIRRRVELSKLVRTFREMRRLFTRYSVQNTKGRYRDRETGEEVRDRHFRVDVDLLVTSEMAESLRKLKHILEL